MGCPASTPRHRPPPLSPGQLAGSSLMISKFKAMRLASVSIHCGNLARRWAGRRQWCRRRARRRLAAAAAEQPAVLGLRVGGWVDRKWLLAGLLVEGQEAPIGVPATAAAAHRHAAAGRA